MSDSVPMFPLGSVLLPGTAIPLHIFEPRYRAMIQDCLRADRRFGVTLIARGSEVGGGDLRTSVGVLAEIIRAAELDDGRWGLVAVGLSRIRVLRWLPDDPYPRAEIEQWDEDEELEPDPEDLQELLAVMRETSSMAAALEGAEAAELPELPTDPVALSHLLVACSPLGTVDRFDLLCASGVTERLRTLRERLDDQRVLLGAELAMRDQH